MDEKLVWIKKVQKKGQKYLVFVDDETDGIVFTEDQIVSNRIIKGNSFYQKDWNKIVDSLDEGIIFEKVLRYIDYKMRSEKEVIIYLEDKGVDSDLIDKLIKKLKDIKFIDDDRYAKQYTEECIRNEKGPYAIKYVLQNKGIASDIIDKYLEAYSPNTAYDNALDIAKKTIKSIGGLPLSKQKEAIYTRLQRMGFNYDHISSVLNKITYNELDYDLLEKEYLKLKSKETDKQKIISKLLTKGYNFQDIKRVIQE